VFWFRIRSRPSGGLKLYVWNLEKWAGCCVSLAHLAPLWVYVKTYVIRVLAVPLAWWCKTICCLAAVMYSGCVALLS
jgi:hypothetical protein